MRPALVALQQCVRAQPRGQLLLQLLAQLVDPLRVHRRLALGQFDFARRRQQVGQQRVVDGVVVEQPRQRLAPGIQRSCASPSRRFS